MTANALIALALKELGVLASGETPSSAEAADALSYLNNMLDSWNAERLTVYHIARNGGSTDTNTFALVASQAAYTIGQSGTPSFNVVRPAKITSASIEYLANPAEPLELPMDPIFDWQDWQRITDKVVTSNIPRWLYVDDNFPNRTLRPWPVPSEVHNLILYYWQAISSFATLATNNTYPPGYARALVFNLAEELAESYGKPVSRSLEKKALMSKAVIKSMNLPTPVMDIDPVLSSDGHGDYDWRVDEPAGR